MKENLTMPLGANALEMPLRVPILERRHSHRFVLGGCALAVWSGGTSRVIDASDSGARLQGMFPRTEANLLMALKLPFQVPVMVKARILRQSNVSAHKSDWSVTFRKDPVLAERLGVSATLADAFQTSALAVLVLAPKGSVLEMFMLELRADGHRVDVTSSHLEALWLLGAKSNYKMFIAHEDALGCESDDLKAAMDDVCPGLEISYWSSRCDAILSEYGEPRYRAVQAPLSTNPYSRGRAKDKVSRRREVESPVRRCMSCDPIDAMPAPDGRLFCMVCVERSKQSTLCDMYDDIGVCG